MTANNEKNEKFEAFKAGLLKWKNEHREEYNEFARHMTNCDGNFYYHIFKAVSRQMSHIAREWELSWGDDADETFDSMFMLVAKENLPKQIADMFAVAVPDRERKHRWMDLARQDVIQEIGSVTETAPLPEAAKENVQPLTPRRKKSKACPLIDYLPADSGEAVISYIRSYVTTHQSAMLQALPYFVLKEIPLRQPLLNSDSLFSMEWNMPLP